MGGDITDDERSVSLSATKRRAKKKRHTNYLFIIRFVRNPLASIVLHHGTLCHLLN